MITTVTFRDETQEHFKNVLPSLWDKDWVYLAGINGGQVLIPTDRVKLIETRDET